LRAIFPAAGISNALDLHAENGDGPGHRLADHFLVPWVAAQTGTDMTGQRGEYIMSYRARALITTALALGAAGLIPHAGAAAAPATRDGLLRISVVESFFRDVPEKLAFALMQPFGMLMKAETGFESDLQRGGAALELGKKLAEDKVDLAVFQGIEFAWARQNYPKLRPLMLIVNQHPYRQAYLVVGQKAGIKAMADLRGKTLAIPRYTREHCYLFLARLCRLQGTTPEQLFGKITKSANAEAALDDVVDGVVPAALIEEVPLSCYQRRKPGRSLGLTVLKRSEVFPTTVVAYRAGRLGQKTLDSFKDAMLNAHRTAIGRQLLSLWRLTGFVAVPSDYQAGLEKIVKIYPAPAEHGNQQAEVARTGKRE
jgi:ABC-type phosphate/phosphonate transport system substrate-binding protein